METPSKGEPASAVTSVQVLGPGGVPDPASRERSGLVPVMALVILIAFGGGYLLARNPGRSVLPETIEETTLSTTTTTASPTMTPPSADVTLILNSQPAGWFALPPPVLAEGVTLVARDEGRWVDDVAVDRDGFVWALGSGVATRWDPADGTQVTFGEEVFGYAVPDQVAAGPDGVVWIAAGREVFRFDGTWGRFRFPDPGEHPIELGVTPSGEVIVVVAMEDDDAVRLYRTGPDGDPTTAEALHLPMADVNDMAVGPRGEVWLAGGGEDAQEVFALEGSRLTLLPRTDGAHEVGDVAANSWLWVTDPEGWVLYALEDGEWVDVDLPDTGQGPWGGRYPWTVGAGDSVWAAAATPDGSGLQILRIDAPGSYVTYPPLDGVSGFVNAIEVAADGVVWLGTEHGLCSFEPDTGLWRLWTTPPAAGSLPSSIESVAVGPDETLRAVLGTEPPLIGSYDGSTWEFEDRLIPPGCEEYEYCTVEMVGAADGVVWVLVSTPTGITLWRDVTGQRWDPVALPDEVPALGIPLRLFGAGWGGSLWLARTPWTAFFDGTDWTVWSQEDCPDGALLVGADGTLWMLEGGWFPDRLWFFSAGQWFPSAAPLPSWAWPIAVAGREGSIWVAVDRSVYRFDGSTWTLEFETDGLVTSLAPAGAGTMWVSGTDLWLIGDGPPVLVAQGLNTWQLAPTPDGSVWALAEGGLYRVEYPG